jgi:hypothetical protein
MEELGERRVLRGLSLHGLDPSSTPDIETFWREIADPICLGANGRRAGQSSTSARLF